MTNLFDIVMLAMGVYVLYAGITGKGKFYAMDNIKEGMEKKFKSTMRKCYTGLGIVMLLNSCVSFLQSYLYTVKDGEVVAKQDLGSWAFLTPTLFNVLIYVFLGLTIVGIVLMAVLMRRFVDKEAEKRGGGAECIPGESDRDRC